MICRPVCGGEQKEHGQFYTEKAPTVSFFYYYVSYTVQYRPSVGEWALRAVLLHVHAKEANVHAINLLEGEKCFGSVGKGLGHFTRVNKPVVIKTSQILATIEHLLMFSLQL